MTMLSKFAGTCKACGCRFPIGAEIVWTAGGGARHATINACDRAKIAQAQSPLNFAKVDLSPVALFLKQAHDRGLKAPKLRVLASDAKSELRLGLTTKGVMPGSVSVKLNDNFLGCVRPDGTTTSNLSQDVNLQNHLLNVAKDPAKAAKEYAALMGLCSFCGKQLTDAGSVEVGYGPICAEKYGLPHTAKGTPMLRTPTSPRNQNAIPGWSAGID